MKGIKSRDKAERIHKRNIMIMSVFMLVLLLGSTAGFAIIYASGSDDGQQDFEGTLPLGNTRDDIKDIPVNIQTGLGGYSGSTVYIASNNSAAVSAIASVVGQYASRIQEACYGECDSDLPEKDCSENMIVYTQKEENIVYQLENCMFIEGDLKAVDAFLYRLVGSN